MEPYPTKQCQVSLLTYQTVIGVRYHELVKLSAGEYLFGRFLSDLSAKRGGFLPILWDAPKSDTYAVQDIGMVVDHLQKIFTFTTDPEETLAVLHNKNRLVHAFSRSGWIQDTLGEILSRSVTSCAGVTAKVTIIAQTRIGSLSGLRRIPHGEEAENSFEVQREEAAARATVALTRAKELCVILGPLDMLGLIGAATVVGSLMYGVGICWRQDLELHYQQEEAEGSMVDVKMINMLKGAGPSSDLPPLALAEIVHVSKEEFIVREIAPDHCRYLAPEMALPQECCSTTLRDARRARGPTHQKYHTNSAHGQVRSTSTPSSFCLRLCT